MDVAAKRKPRSNDFMSRRAVIAQVDDVERSAREWAKYLDITKDCIVGRMKRGMTLEQAVLYSVNKAWNTVNTGNQCKAGHEYTPENTRTEVLPNGRTARRCRICQANWTRLSQRRRRARKRAPINPGLCGAGAHKLEGDNLIVRIVRGQTVRMCRACRNAKAALRKERVARGLPGNTRETAGMTIDQKIAFFSRPQPSGCVLWAGPIGGAPGYYRPKVYHKGLKTREGKPTAALLVRQYLWEKKYGRKPPEGHVLAARCGNDERCIADAHTYATPLRARTGSKEAKQKRKKSMILLHAEDRGRYLEEAQQHAARVKATLAERFPSLVSELDDVVQEALLSIYLQWAEHRREIADVHAYFMMAAFNECHSRLRAYRPAESFSDIDAETIQCENPLMANPAEIIEALEERFLDTRRYAQREYKMPPGMRQVWELRKIGLSYKEIADRLDISINTVEQHMGRAYARIRGRRVTLRLSTMLNPELLPV
jgi:RNA polymerase sigma factor (sigma-70 family)